MALPYRPVPGWVLASAVLAPVATIGGWTLAAGRQETFDPVRETISALAAAPSTSPWIMTAGLAALLVWFGLELQQVTPSARDVTGLAERALAGAQSLWRLAVVLLLRARLHTRGPRAPQVSTSVGSPVPVGKGEPR